MGSWFGFGKAVVIEIAADSASCMGDMSPAASSSSRESLAPSTIPMSSDWTTGAPLTPRQISELDKMYSEMKRQRTV